MSKRRKVVIVGPVGAGKTTAVRSLTDDRCIVTDVKSSSTDGLKKEMTTVAMDFGIVPLSDNDFLHVYGAPGQKRFTFMWDILSMGAFGIILLIDNCSDDPKGDLNTFLDAFAHQIAETRFILGVTRTDLKATPPLEDYAKWLGEYGINAEVACVDPRINEDVRFLMDRILASQPGHTKTPFALDEGSAIEPEDEIAAEPVEAPVHAEPPAGDDLLFNTAKEQIKGDIESMRAEDRVFNTARKLKGVKGVTLTNGVGETIHSSMGDVGLSGITALLNGLGHTLEEAVGMGSLRSITLRGADEDTLTVLPGSKNRALGMTSERRHPPPWEQVEELKQWVHH